MTQSGKKTFKLITSSQIRVYSKMKSVFTEVMLDYIARRLVGRGNTADVFDIGSGLVIVVQTGIPSQ